MMGLYCARSIDRWAKQETCKGLADLLRRHTHVQDIDVLVCLGVLELGLSWRQSANVSRVLMISSNCTQHTHSERQT